MARPKTDRTKRTLRLPPKLDAKLTSEAKANGQSVNAEITQRLRATLEGYWR